MLKPARLMALVILGVLLGACRPALMAPEEIHITQEAVRSLVRVTATGQGYLLHRPWQQRRPVTHTAIGVIVTGHKVLVTGLMLADHRYIELETIDTQRKSRAEVEVVDYEANLALLKPVDPDFLANRKPMSLSTNINVGQNLNIWQVKPNGDVLPATGQVTSIELSAFTLGNFFLTYRVESTLQYRFNNLTLPVVRAGMLAGLVLRSSSKDQAIDVIAEPVIRHFLRDAEQGQYQGFPVAGFHYGPTVDPQLRGYIGLTEDTTGIYIQKVIKGSPADKAGLQAGDVITQIGDHKVSNTGQFDHPQYGKTSLVHLIRTMYYAGDSVPVHVFRQGQNLVLHIVLDHRRPEEYLVPPYIVDQVPDYLIVGGLVFQELSMSYLREYGKDWSAEAPVDLLYYNQNQDYLSGDHREKIVIISSVIPTSYTIGYENLSDLVVLKVNGQPIGKLSDVRKALASPINGFHKIEVKQHPKVIYLDARELPKINEIIRQRYRIPISPAQAAPN